LNAVQIKDGVYWVGATDWSLRNFHGYTTYRGSSYNAYLIVDEKITMVDTVKNEFSGELLSRISSVIDPSKIDYIISNHVEPDHSGALKEIMSLAPNAKIITSSPQGIKGLTNYYGEFEYIPVKSGETLNIGKRTLSFVSTPMLHWPDNMVTYCADDKILYSNDAFGQHYASGKRFDNLCPADEIMQEAQKYYANIVMPFANQVKTAYGVVSALDIDIIAPSHGIVWREDIGSILDKYALWSSDECARDALVVFDSMWHSTEKMAKVIAEAFTDKGITVKYYDLKQTHISDIMVDVLTSKYICVGSPTLNNNMLPTVSAFLTYLSGLTAKGKKAFAFGSYGWSGQSIGQVEERLLSCGYELMCEKCRIQYLPTDDALAKLSEQIKESI